MVFSSLTFLFGFLPLFFICYYAAGRLFGIRGKNVALFLFSLAFYAWGEPVYILLMIYSTILDYTCGRMIEDGEIIGYGKHEELMEGCPEYKEISDSQMGGAFLD